MPSGTSSSVTEDLGVFPLVLLLNDNVDCCGGALEPLGWPKNFLLGDKYQNWEKEGGGDGRRGEDMPQRCLCRLDVP